MIPSDAVLIVAVLPMLALVVGIIVSEWREWRRS